MDDHKLHVCSAFAQEADKITTLVIQFQCAAINNA